ncbi:hypothetical protein DBZ47_05975 [Escherichia coli]|nr:hypothetical protein [Escherichia coli]EFN8410129.1 hypothetical protein [Escherichia coli O7]EEW2535542.1 hypothetical protein [Escherichia coli]EEW7849051.1 hypothetical protein [Escherichia coli]EFO2852536.1 hypothetical protein [Escherichia coli]
MIDHKIFILQQVIMGFLDSLRPLQSIYLHLINLPFLLYPIFYIILIQSLQTFRNRRNTSPFCCK